VGNGARKRRFDFPPRATSFTYASDWRQFDHRISGSLCDALTTPWLQQAQKTPPAGVAGGVRTAPAF